MKTAKRIDEFTPANVFDVSGTLWLDVDLSRTAAYSHYKAMPNVAEYEGKRFYKMSYNTDTYFACYKEAKDRPYHMRYAS